MTILHTNSKHTDYDAHNADHLLLLFRRTRTGEPATVLKSRLVFAIAAAAASEQRCVHLVPTPSPSCTMVTVSG